MRVVAHGAVTARAWLVTALVGAACRVQPETAPIRAASERATPEIARVDRAAPTAESDHRRTELVAWVVPYESSLRSLERNAQWISIASPTYFGVAFRGGRPALVDWDPAVPFPRSRLTRARSRASFGVLPLVGCIGSCGPRISRVLDDANARDAHVSDLVRVATAQGLEGLFVDYEDVDAAAENVTRFVSALAGELHARQKKLGLVVQEPCGVDPACRRLPYPFDLGTLAHVTDLLAVMEYDYAVDGSAPPAPRDWVERGLERVVAEVPPVDRGKVLCALPLYGRISAGSGDRAVLFQDVGPTHVGTWHARVGPSRFDDEALSKVATATSGSTSATLYFEDRETLAARLALVSSYRLGGVALWRLGGEDPCAWAELARYRAIAPPDCR